MIIGVTGKFCAGKDTVARGLEERGYSHYSLSDHLRQELRNRGKIEFGIEDLRILGNELREKYGAGILAEIALKSFGVGGKYVVTSIRNPTEADVLESRGDFYFVAVQASPETRFKRMMKRGRKDDYSKTFEEFIETEARQLEGDENAQNLEACIEMANYRIDNEENSESFSPIVVIRPKIKKLFEEIESRKISWDAYFLNQLEGIAAKATCDRGRSGALIARDKRQLTTGYVGSPVGLPHCDEEGHLFEMRYNSEGTSSKHCIRTTHAEANAIAQAAKAGISINGATLYCKMVPCRDCAKLIINSGIKKVVAAKDYQRSELTKEWFDSAKIDLVIIDTKIEKY